MPSFELTPNDPRVGRRTPEGRQWPQTDILGQPVNRMQGGLTTRALGNGYFVVIPPGMDGEIQVTLVDETPAFPPLAAPRLYDEDEPDAAG
ncbi:MAG: hypothetical protein BroJett018_16620 [Chloroflexota bacterium]|nr:MAG: hypothetical protein BroJett018_16620 [Chloroflexota bacterium]